MRVFDWINFFDLEIPIFGESLSCYPQQFTFGVFREGFFADIFLINVTLGFFVQGVVSSGVILLGCKPIARSLEG